MVIVKKKVALGVNPEAMVVNPEASTINKKVVSMKEAVVGSKDTVEIKTAMVKAKEEVLQAMILSAEEVDVATVTMVIAWEVVKPMELVTQVKSRRMVVAR